MFLTLTNPASIFKTITYDGKLFVLAITKNLNMNSSVEYRDVPSTANRKKLMPNIGIKARA